MKNRHVLGRILHVLLVLSLSYALLRVLYWSFMLLADDAQQANLAPHPESDVEKTESDKPNPQKIAESLNTFWLTYDLDHCRNGVKSWDQ
ncbi:hypothetical protein SLS60_008177 [Paraconiothyrium brasiliense]|uniref:Uncharacterized protein n=1 Tax=Paraconiothyrium brasiliense TaxID=300254 RepID=A0ABR3QZW0_9PLEO